MIALLAVLALLKGAPVDAPPGSDATEAKTGRQILLSADSPSQVYEVRISANVTTNLLFDAPVQISRLENRESFRRVAVMEDAILLVAARELKWGTRVRMTVHFTEGARLSSVDFVLRVVPQEQAERQVEVYSPRASDSCLEEHDELHQCRAELERKCAELEGRSGLTALLALEWMDVRGVLARPLNALAGSAEQTPYPKEAVSYRTYRSGEDETTPSTVRVAVELQMNNKGSQPWMAEGAALVAEDGTRHVLSVWQPAPIEPGPRQQRVVVEAEMKETEARGLFTLELWSEEHTSSVSFGGVSFP